MTALAEALGTGDAGVLIATAAVLGAIHTVLGPDHYVPFAALARAHGWSHRRTLAWTVLGGIGHVASSVVLGAALAAAGLAAHSWAGSRWEAWNEARGSVAAWMLVGLGAAVTVHGIVRGARRRAHAHPHRHEDGRLHAHPHGHGLAHAHAHAEPREARRATPWILFLVLVFGPCESLIPLMLAALAVGGWAATAAVALVFAATTIATMVGAVFALRAGLALLPGRFAERHALTLAGVSLVLCGVAVGWLGL